MMGPEDPCGRPGLLVDGDITKSNETEIGISGQSVAGILGNGEAREEAYTKCDNTERNRHK